MSIQQNKKISYFFALFLETLISSSWEQSMDFQISKSPAAGYYFKYAVKIDN